MPSTIAKTLRDAAATLADEVDALSFDAPVAFVYNPLRYAWTPHLRFIEKFGASKKEVVFLGMNPGPFGMAQTGVPFGEVSKVRDWMKIEEKVNKPPREHPKRPVLGFACTRAEVSGARLWGAAAEKHPDAATFFARAFVLNYCPLVFMGESGTNLTPDKLPSVERTALEAACDKHLAHAIDALDPDVVVGVGGFATQRLSAVVPDRKIGTILHPSPASPAANRGWATAARASLANLAIRDLL